MMTTVKYKLPESVDEEGLPYSIKSRNILPDFIKFENNRFTFSPTLKKDAGQHEINLCLTDSYGAMGCEGFILTVNAPIQTKKYDIVKPNNGSSTIFDNKK